MTNKAVKRHARKTVAALEKLNQEHGGALTPEAMAVLKRQSRRKALELARAEIKQALGKAVAKAATKASKPKAKAKAAPKATAAK